MGGTNSRPRVAEVDLLPPRFSPAPDPLARLSVCPVEYMVGRGELRSLLFDNFVNERQTLWLRPRDGWRAGVADEADGLEATSGAAAVAAGSSAVLKLSMTPSATERLAPTVGMLACLGAGGGGRGGAAEVAAFARMSSVDSPPLFWTLGGTLLHNELSVRGAAFVPRLGLASHAAVQMEPTTAPAVPGGPRGDMLKAAVVGARWGSRTGALSVGGNVHSNGGAEAWTQLAGDAFRAGLRVAVPDGQWRNPRIVKQASLTLFSMQPGDLRPTYEAGVAANLDGSRFVASFLHRMVLRRQVRNPFEAEHVKGIYSYLDLGFVMEQTDGGSAFAAACAWLLNKNVMGKVKVGRDSISTSAVLHSWVDPCVTVTLGSRYSLSRGTLSPGIHISLEKGAPVEYQRASADAVRRVRPRRIEALRDARADEVLPAFPEKAPGATNVAADGTTRRVDRASADSVLRAW